MLLFTSYFGGREVFEWCKHISARGERVLMSFHTLLENESLKCTICCRGQVLLLREKQVRLGVALEPLNSDIASSTFTLTSLHPFLFSAYSLVFSESGASQELKKMGVSILNYFFFWRDLQGPSLSKRIQDTQPLPNPSHASWTFIGYLPSQTLIPFPVHHHHHHASSRHNTSTKED